MTDTARLQEIMHTILHGQTDAFAVAYLSPDGVTELCMGGDVQAHDQQEVAFKLLYGYMLRNAADEFADGDAAEFVADGLQWLDDEDQLRRDMVEDGHLPDEFHPDQSGGQSAADLLADMVADADPDLPGWDDEDDDEDGEPGGTDIPVN